MVRCRFITQEKAWRKILAWEPRMISQLGHAVRMWLSELGLAFRTLWAILMSGMSLWKRPRLITTQLHFIGNYSLIIILVSGLFVGFVLAYQGYYTLNRYGSEEALGLLVALALTRELGPVITALLFAGRAGTSLTAEIGLMKAGEQLAAMEMMAVNPIQRVLAPRFIAGFIAMPILAILFTAMGIWGGYLVGVQLIGVDEGAFWSQMQGGVDLWDDIGNGIIKSIVFGIAVTFIALYQGYQAQPTPEGVSRATTRTVVISSLMVLWLDFVLTALMFK
jgi:phospholipid/cholesterol/gamma-HCH transport system permease protein